MKTIAKEINVRWRDVILLAILGALIIYNIYVIMAHLSPYNLISDSVNEITYKQLAFEEKTFFPKGYICSSEHFVSRTVLLYWLFYSLTGNFILSYQLEMIVMLIALLLALTFLLKQLKVSFNSICLALILFVLYTSWECCFVIQYSFGNYSKISLLIFLTLAIRMRLKEVWQRKDYLSKKQIVDFILLVIFAFILGIGSPRALIVLYLPLLLVDVLKVFATFTENLEIRRENFFLIILSGGLLLINLVAYFITVHCFSADFQPITSGLVSAEKFLAWDSIAAQIKAVLYCCGLGIGTRVFSIEGLRMLCRLFFVSLSLYYMYWNFKHKRHEIISFFCISTLLVFASTLLSEYSYNVPAPRYYFVINLFIPIVCAMALSEWTAEKKQIVSQIVSALMVFVSTVLFVCVLSIEGHAEFTTIDANPNKADLFDVSQYICANKYEYVTASYWNAGVIKGYTNGMVETQHSYDTPNGIASLEPFYWLIDTNKFVDEKQGIRNILLLTDEEEALAFDNKSRRVDVLLSDYAKKVAEIGKYNLYALDENPFTLIKKIEEKYKGGLPAINECSAVDYPTDIGYLHVNSELNENNELVSNGTGGVILYGPYTDSVPGKYDITLHYVVDVCPTGAVGEFDIALNAERQKSVRFSDRNEIAILRDVCIEGGKLFEARVFVPEGMIVRIDLIEYKRVE